jgi:hypothetical protein
MSVKHWATACAFLFWAAPLAAQTVQESSTTAEAPYGDQSSSPEETESRGEAKDIIPPEGIKRSTETLNAASIYTEKKPYDQARDELIHALELWNAGHPEAASDTALEAYDDLVELRRAPGVKRSQLRQMKRQAAEIYTKGGIACIKSYVKRQGNTPDAILEGKARMEDLRDVARNYNDLNKQLSQAIDQLGLPVSPQNPVGTTQP